MITEALARTRPVEKEQFQTGQVITISTGHAVHDSYAAFLAPLLPVFIENLALTRTEAGLLTVFFQAPSLLQPFIGHLADRVSLRYFVILAPAAAGLTMSLLGVMPTYAALAMLLILAGINSAALHSIGPVMAGNLSGNRLGRGMGIWMVGGEVGWTLGPVAVVIALQLLTLRGMPWLMAGGLLASGLLYVRLKDISGRPPNAGQGLPWKNALRAMGPLLVPLTGIIIGRAFMVAALTTYLPIFLTEQGAELWFAGVSLSILEAAGVIGALLSGSLSDRLGRRLMLLISMVTAPIFMLVFLMTSGWARLPLLLLLGLSVLSTNPVIMAMVQENAPQNRALANGTYMSLAFLIQAGTVVVLGGISDSFGLQLAFIVSAVIPFFGLPFLLLLPPRRR